ncbi:SDR family oxidoreductase (plasmid) [Paracoccus methylovorus]|uniref:SDR family oxidoreductase n=1 Tax=Paracoccus methylovorus TaxID=2812658 RepID=A0ABX7JPE3_9RHOB|nr:SDR family oxidoreductase [Paracoccus methylovorus]QRZ16136.1 SDR family oxidoreductase [Paracoccus methylovorus]
MTQTADKGVPVALVTGAAYGIGAASAVQLAKDGHDLVLFDLKTEMLDETAAAIRALGCQVECLTMDLRDDASIEAGIDAALATFGRVDVLVNNAGIPMRKPALEVTREDFNLVMDINLAGTFVMSRIFGDRLIAAGRPGVIVSIASTHGLHGVPESSTYGIAKAGVAHMTRMLAIEWAKHNIRVNAVAPGSTVTPTRTGLSDPAKRDALMARFPLNRFGSPEDTAEAVSYLVRAGFVTGHVLVVDGGLTAK